VPLLYTPQFVVEKLQGGADLMTPGLQRGPPFPPKATKGAIVAIASLEAPTIPVVVGTCEIDVSSLEKVQGAKGHAVQTFHWASDEIWSWSTTGNPGIDPPGFIQGWDDEQDEDTQLATQTAAMGLQHDQKGGVQLDSNPTERSEAEKAQGIEGASASTNKDFIEEVEDKELTTNGAIKSPWFWNHILTSSRDRRCLLQRFPIRRTAPYGSKQRPTIVRS
jgi:translation initiation factor 2D